MLFICAINSGDRSEKSLFPHPSGTQRMETMVILSGLLSFIWGMCAKASFAPFIEKFLVGHN